MHVASGTRGAGASEPCRCGHRPAGHTAGMRTIGLVAILVATSTAAVAGTASAAAGVATRDPRATTRVIGVTGPAGDRDVTRLGPWVVRSSGNPTFGGARAAFGRPTRCASRGPGYATASWRPVGLRATFYTLDIPPAGPACRAARLFVGSATLTGPSWQTSKGLRVGDTLARVTELYPRSGSVRRLYPGISYPAGRWQLEVRNVFGSRSPLLLAVMRSGRVVAFEVALGRGGE